MKKDILESYLGKNVTVTLSGKKKIKGVLYKTDSDRYANYPNFYLRKNFYVLEYDTRSEYENPYSCIFRSSHVVWLKEGEKE